MFSVLDNSIDSEAVWSVDCLGVEVADVSSTYCVTLELPLWVDDSKGPPVTIFWEDSVDCLVVVLSAAVGVSVLSVVFIRCVALLLRVDDSKDSVIAMVWDAWVDCITVVLSISCDAVGVAVLSVTFITCVTLSL